MKIPSLLYRPHPTLVLVQERVQERDWFNLLHLWRQTRWLLYHRLNTCSTKMIALALEHL